MRLDEDLVAKWEAIINEVDKDHVPLECVNKVIFRLDNNRQKTINFQTLKKQQLDIEEINLVVERFIRDNEDRIKDMEFVLDIKAVAQMLQPTTDQLLGKL